MNEQKNKKLFTDLFTVDEFIDYYHDAGRRELKYILKSLGGKHKHHGKRESNQRDAIIALLS